ncbi:MAG: L,D-transpeptidase [Luteolibacter sp.]
MPALINIRILQFFFVVFAAGCFVSCTPAPPPPPPVAGQVLYEWYDDGGAGEISIRINLRSQIATIYRGNREVGWCYVATGRQGHGTPAGSFRISEKTADKVSNRWGWQEDEFGEVINPSVRFDKPVPRGARFVYAPMPYWMRLTDYGIGLHGGYIPTPGMPASAGCIRLPEQFAPVLFNEVKLGTPVTITR